MKFTLSLLTGQLPHVAEVYYYFLCYNACLLKRKLGSVEYHYTMNPEKGQPMAVRQASGPAETAMGGVCLGTLSSLM